MLCQIWKLNIFVFYKPMIFSKVFAKNLQYVKEIIENFIGERKREREGDGEEQREILRLYKRLYLSWYL